MSFITKDSLSVEEGIEQLAVILAIYINSSTQNINRSPEWFVAEFIIGNLSDFIHDSSNLDLNFENQKSKIVDSAVKTEIDRIWNFIKKDFSLKNLLIIHAEIIVKNGNLISIDEYKNRNSVSTNRFALIGWVDTKQTHRKYY